MTVLRSSALGVALVVVVLASACGQPTVEAESPQPSPVAGESTLGDVAGDSATEPASEATVTPENAPQGDQPDEEQPEQAPCADPARRLPARSGGGEVVFFAVCDASAAPYPVLRPSHVRYEQDPQERLTAYLDAMAGGLSTAEAEAGLFSWFGDVEVSGVLGPNGVVDLSFTQDGEPWVSVASTSHQTLSLVDPLAATVFLVEEVTAISRAGMCFGEMDCAGLLTREDFASRMLIKDGMITNPTCSIYRYWSEPSVCDARQVAATTTRETVVVNVADNDVLQVRAGPSADAFPAGTPLRSGENVAVTDHFAIAPDGGLWRLISADTGNGPTGAWVNAAYLAPPSEAEAHDPVALAWSLAAFAAKPSQRSLERVGFATQVDLALGATVHASVDRDDLLRRETWVIDAEHFRAYEGPFDILQPLDRSSPYAASRFEVVIGEHNHCAGDPMPAPEGYEAATQVALLAMPGASPGTIDTCLQWWAVDVFLNDAGEVAAVSLDRWEP